MQMLTYSEAFRSCSVGGRGCGLHARGLLLGNDVGDLLKFQKSGSLGRGKDLADRADFVLEDPHFIEFPRINDLAAKMGLSIILLEQAPLLLMLTSRVHELLLECGVTLESLRSRCLALALVVARSLGGGRCTGVRVLGLL